MLELNNKVRKVSGLFMMMLVVGMILVTPVLACPAGTNCGNTSLSGGKPIQLTGEEKDKAVNMALKNSQVEKLQSQLKDEGFTQKDSEAFIVPVKADNGSVTNTQVVAIGFESSSAEANVTKKTMMFAYDPVTDGTAVIEGTGWDCTLCAAGIAGCGACAASCAAINAACILCLASVCTASLYQCTVCCCNLGNQWCCDRLKW